MNRASHRAAVVLSACAVTACATELEAPAGPGFQIEVAPLQLQGLADACYDILVENSTPDGVTAAANNVVSLTNICASRYGNSTGGDITYIATCDASVETNWVTLMPYLYGPDGLDTDSDPDLLADWQNPCLPNGCSLPRPCDENRDTLVEFNLTIMREAQQGFFDVAVNFSDIFCSAKVDCRYESGEWIRLVHGSDGVRTASVVAALACTDGNDIGSPGATHIYRSNVRLACAGASTLVGLYYTQQVGGASPVPFGTISDQGVQTELAQFPVGTEENRELSLHVAPDDGELWAFQDSRFSNETVDGGGRNSFGVIDTTASPPTFTRKGDLWTTLGFELMFERPVVGFTGDGRLLVYGFVGSSEFKLVELDRDTGQPTTLLGPSTSISNLSTSFAPGPGSSVYYVQQAGGSSAVPFGLIDISSGATVTPIGGGLTLGTGDQNPTMQLLTAPDGTLWAFNLSDSGDANSFGRVNTSTGTFEVVGDLRASGISSNFFMVAPPVLGFTDSGELLIYGFFGGSPTLGRIDTTTGAFTTILANADYGFAHSFATPHSSRAKSVSEVPVGSAGKVFDTNPEGPVDQAVVFMGAEDLVVNGTNAGKVFWNVAIGLDELGTSGQPQLGAEATDCFLTFTATAAEGALALSSGESFLSYPFIETELRLTNASGTLVCDQHPLNGPDLITNYRSEVPVEINSGWLLTGILADDGEAARVSAGQSGPTINLSAEPYWCVDLETQTLSSGAGFMGCEADDDISWSWASGAVLFWNEQFADVALLLQSFGDVTSDDLADACFKNHINDPACTFPGQADAGSTSWTALVRTAEGNVYKLAWVSGGADGAYGPVQFQYALLGSFVD